MAATDITKVGDGLSGMKDGFPTGEETGIGMAIESCTVTGKGKEAFRLNYVGNTIGYKLWDLQSDIKWDGFLTGDIQLTALAMGAIIASFVNAVDSHGVSGGKMIVRPGGTISLTTGGDAWAKRSANITRFPYITVT